MEHGDGVRLSHYFSGFKLSNGPGSDWTRLEASRNLQPCSPVLQSTQRLRFVIFARLLFENSTCRKSACRPEYEYNHSFIDFIPEAIKVCSFPRRRPLTLPLPADSAGTTETVGADGIDKVARPKHRIMLESQWATICRGCITVQMVMARTEGGQPKATRLWRRPLI